jgi:hypothetical protein
MNTLSDLETVVQETVASLLFKGYDFKTYYVENKTDHIYAIITTAHESISASLIARLARIEGDKVVIEEDMRGLKIVPLYQAFMARGIPREQMVLDYLHGESPDEYHR